MDQPVFSLLQVMQSVRKTLATRYTSAFWVRAEMNKLNHYSHSGHCYPELVEKQDGKVIAQVNSTLWRDEYRKANELFKKLLNEPLRDGIKIMFRARINFDPVHGISLNILEIDPAFTLGDLEREKKETLEKLSKLGLLEANKKLRLPLLPQRIAVISVETSKGYADFLSVIDQNPWNYKFFHMLFPSILQGEKAVEGITGQLARISKAIQHFDVVAIIRGGGGDVGLSVYNDYRIASAIASFPIPVLSGIGHATNLTASEMVAHSYAITPTKLAETLIQRIHQTAQPLVQFGRSIAAGSETLLRRQKLSFDSETKLFRSATRGAIAGAGAKIMELQRGLSRETSGKINMDRSELAAAIGQTAKAANLMVERASADIDSSKLKLQRESRRILIARRENLAFLSGQMASLDPEHVLRRGYSITRYQGQAIRDPAQLPEGAEIETQLFKGVIKSRTTT